MQAFLLVLAGLIFSIASESSGLATTADAGLDVEAVTFNIRYGKANDGEHSWPYRKDTVLNLIDTCGADFIGLQESLAMQSKLVKERVGDRYGMIIRTREKRDGEGEATPLLYRLDRWTLDPKEHGTFWLSETPDVPASRSWDTSLPRIATWGRFIDKKTSHVVWVYNTHFDHRSAAARLGAAKLIAQRISTDVPAGVPVIVMGDLNATPESPPLKALLTGQGSSPRPLEDAWHTKNPTETNECTFNGWAEGLKGRRIDYVLVSTGAKVTRSTIMRTRVEGRPVSDHWPVEAKIVFPQSTVKTGS